MAYFNHAFQKTFVATKATQAAVTPGSTDGLGVAGVGDGILTSLGIHVSNLKSTALAEGYRLGPGVTGLFGTKGANKDLSVDGATIAADACPFYLGSASIKTSDLQGSFHGGYQESHKSKAINPQYLRKAWAVEGNAPNRAVIQIGGTPDNIAGDTSCEKEFLCGEDYNLKIDIKGTPALRFANHNLYRTLQANGGCCVDPLVPVAVDAVVIYKQWVNAIIEDAYLKDFIRPILVIDGVSYAATEAILAEEGLVAGNTFALAPDVSTIDAGIILLGSYEDTQFANCTFQITDYYGKEPIQIYASEVDLNGDPCTFEGLCVVTTCPGIQANGLGESVLRNLILSESYLQNFMHNDLRIREITQGTSAYDIIDRNTIYSCFYMLHTVPRFNNPSGTFDNDQYLLEVVGTDAMVAALKVEIDLVIAASTGMCEPVDINTPAACTYILP